MSVYNYIYVALLPRHQEVILWISCVCEVIVTRAQMPERAEQLNLLLDRFSFVFLVIIICKNCGFLLPIQSAMWLPRLFVNNALDSHSSLALSIIE